MKNIELVLVLINLPIAYLAGYTEKYILLFIPLYCAIGCERVRRDFKQPYHNQPHYVRHSTLFGTLLRIILWPTLIAQDINYFYNINSVRGTFAYHELCDQDKDLSAYHKSSLFKKIRSLNQSNEFKEILTICSQHLTNQELSPRIKAELWCEMAYCYKLLDYFDKAIEFFLRTLEIDCDHLDANEGLAQTYLKIKDYNSAKIWLEKTKNIFEKQIEKANKLGISSRKFSELKKELEKIEGIYNSLYRDNT